MHVILFLPNRLINSAVVIKIHTIEWTPAILNNTALRDGVLVNWGLDPGKEIWEWLKKHNISSDIGIKPLVGQPRNLQGTPFSLTEEFVSVYRMHPLLPDHLNMRSSDTKDRSGVRYLLCHHFGGYLKKMILQPFAPYMYKVIGILESTKFCLRIANP
jgi:hypothetical protein